MKTWELVWAEVSWWMVEILPSSHPFIIFIDGFSITKTSNIIHLSFVHEWGHDNGLFKMGLFPILVVIPSYHP